MVEAVDLPHLQEEALLMVEAVDLSHLCKSLLMEWTYFHPPPP